MGFYGYIEIRDIDLFPITNRDCVNMGKPLFAILEAFADYYVKGKRSSSNQWFLELERQAIISLHTLINAMYVGEEQLPQELIDEYASGWHIGDPITREELKEMFILEHRWTQAEELIPATMEIIHGLSRDIKETYFFKKEDTLPAFIALWESLNRARQLGGELVRLRFI